MRESKILWSIVINLSDKSVLTPQYWQQFIQVSSGRLNVPYSYRAKCFPHGPERLLLFSDPSKPISAISVLTPQYCQQNVNFLYKTPLNAEVALKMLKWMNSMQFNFADFTSDDKVVDADLLSWRWHGIPNYKNHRQNFRTTCIPTPMITRVHRIWVNSEWEIDLWPLNDRSHNKVTVDIFACLFMLYTLTVIFSNWKTLTFWSFWPLTP